MIGEQLALNQVAKHYGAARAVDALDLEIAAGEFVSIVGPSGSGKTTLLTMIAGFERPSTGSIKVGGYDVTRLLPHRRNIGMVFQKYALFPHMTIRQNLEFPLKMRRLAKGHAAQSRVDTMLELVHLERFHDRYPHQLSGGQQQRVAVARALIFDPPVILMDEPLGALDKKLRETMQYEIKRIQQRLGATVIYVTHDQQEALTMSDRVAVMHDGRLEQIGRPVELYNRPRNAFVADFVGTVNFLPGVVSGTTLSQFAVRIGGACLFIDRMGQPLNDSLSSGSKVKAAVRPEHVVIKPHEPDCSESLAGTIETTVFSGSSRTALIRLDAISGEPVRADLPAASGIELNEGSRVSLHFDTAAINLFTEEPGGTR